MAIRILKQTTNVSIELTKTSPTRFLLKAHSMTLPLSVEANDSLAKCILDRNVLSKFEDRYEHDYVGGQEYRIKFGPIKVSILANDFIALANDAEAEWNAKHAQPISKAGWYRLSALTDYYNMTEKKWVLSRDRKDLCGLVVPYASNELLGGLIDTLPVRSDNLKATFLAYLVPAETRWSL